MLNLKVYLSFLFLFNNSIIYVVKATNKLKGYIKISELIIWSQFKMIGYASKNCFFNYLFISSFFFF